MNFATRLRREPEQRGQQGQCDQQCDENGHRRGHPHVGQERDADDRQAAQRDDHRQGGEHHSSAGGARRPAPRTPRLGLSRSRLLR